MTQFIIGGILIAGGALISLLVPRRLKNKSTEIKFAQSIPLAGLKKQLAESAEAGLPDYRQYAEVKGLADAETPEKTPYSEREAAYFKAECYQVYEEEETYTDQTGTHRRMKRRESQVSTQKSYSALLVKDAQSGEKAAIELVESGIQLDTVKTFDKFEPLGAMNQYGFFGMLNTGRMGTRTLGYRMVEHTIGIGQALYVLGDARLENGRLVISKPSDTKKPFIVSTKSEEDLINANERGGVFALIGGIVMAVAGILVIFFVK